MRYNALPSDALSQRCRWSRSVPGVMVYMPCRWRQTCHGRARCNMRYSDLQLSVSVPQAWAASVTAHGNLSEICRPAASAADAPRGPEPAVTTARVRTLHSQLGQLDWFFTLDPFHFRARAQHSSIRAQRASRPRTALIRRPPVLERLNAKFVTSALHYRTTWPSSFQGAPALVCVAQAGPTLLFGTAGPTESAQDRPEENQVCLVCRLCLDVVSAASWSCCCTT